MSGHSKKKKKIVGFPPISASLFWLGETLPKDAIFSDQSLYVSNPPELEHLNIVAYYSSFAGGFFSFINIKGRS